MQTKFFIFTFFSFFLSGCRDKLPEESFAVLPQGGFPKLGYVPDRPALPSAEDIQARKQALSGDALVSHDLKEEILSVLQASEALSELPLPQTPSA